MFLSILEIFKVFLSKRSRNSFFVLFIKLLRRVLLMMDELLLLVKILPSHDLSRITYLIVVLVILMLLNTLIWLPTSRLSFIIATIIKSFVFYARSFLIHYHLLILWICHLCHVSKLRLLLLVRWGIINYLFRRHHIPLRLV